MTIHLGPATITLLRGDITRHSADAIVNAANSSLLGGGGVAGAIHRAGGPAILEDCKKIRATRGTLPAGQAVATTGGNLPAKHVIHTVGPVWRGGDHGEAETLASCYREALRAGDELQLCSIAFPAISTGIYGYPLDEAARVALSAVRGALPGLRHVSEVTFVLFDEAALQAFSDAARTVF